MENEIACPLCGESESVEKVSVLYLTGLNARRSAGSAHFEPGTSDDPAQRSSSVISNSASLNRKLAPPASGKQVLMRSIHPDMIVLVFSVIAPFFLLSIYRSQAGSLIPILVLVVGLYALYFWQRKKIIRQFESQQSQRQAEEQRIHRAIARWMKLYYCAKDEVVFEPGVDQITPVDQMMGFLYRVE